MTKSKDKELTLSTGSSSMELEKSSLGGDSVVQEAVDVDDKPSTSVSTNENKVKDIKEKKCEEQQLAGLPKQRRKKGQTLSSGGGKSKVLESKKKDSKMDIYIQTVLSDTGNETSGIQGEESNGGSIILQAIVDCASETLQQALENTIIQGETFELSNTVEETSVESNQSDASTTAKSVKIKKKVTNNSQQKKDEEIVEEDVLIPIDTGMVVEVFENEDGIESASIPVNTPEKGPGYGYMSYAHNFGVDAETDNKESDAIANLTGDEQEKDKSKEGSTQLQPQYRVQSGYSPKSQSHIPKNTTTKMSHTEATESAIKKSKKPSEEKKETALTSSKTKAKTSKANAKLKNVVSAQGKSVKNISTKAKNVSSKVKNVVSTKVQKKTGTTLKSTTKSDSKTSPKKVKCDPVNSPKEDSKTPQKEFNKKVSKNRKNKIDRINKVMAALNNSPTSSVENTTELLETNLSPTKDKTKKKKKSRSKDKERKDKKRKRKHKSSKEKHDLNGSKKKKKKAKKDKSVSPDKSESLESGESTHHHRHHHHHKPKKKTRKDKGKHRKKSESDSTLIDNSKLNEDKIKKLSDTLSKLESSINSEKLDSKTKHSSSQKSPKKKRPLEKLYDIDVVSLTPKLKSTCKKTLQKQTSKKPKAVCKTKPKQSFTKNSNVAGSRKTNLKGNNRKGKLVEEPKLNISTPLHIDIPEDRPVQYTKGVGRGRGRGRRKYGTSRILAVKKVTPKPKKVEELPVDESQTTAKQGVMEDLSEKQVHDIEKNNTEADHSDPSIALKKKPSDSMERDNKNKEQTPSPQSATTCMSEEALFSDSGIGTDNNSNADHQANEKSRKNHDVEIAPGVMSSHPLATSAHGLYGYGKKEKNKKQLNWPVTLGRRKKKKHRLIRPATRVTPEFIFELDALVLQLRALKLEYPEELENNFMSASGKKNHLSSLVKLTPGFSTMLRPSYLGAAMNIHCDKLKQKKKKKSKHRRRELRENGDGKLTSPLSHHSGEPSEAGDTSPLKVAEDHKTDLPYDTNLQKNVEETMDVVKTNEPQKSMPKIVEEEPTTETTLESASFENLGSSVTEVEQTKSDQDTPKEQPGVITEEEQIKDATDQVSNAQPFQESNQASTISDTPQPIKTKHIFHRIQRTRRRKGKGRGFTRRKIRGTYQSKKLQVLMSEDNEDAILEDIDDEERSSENDESDQLNFEDAIENINKVSNRESNGLSPENVGNDNTQSLEKQCEAIIQKCNQVNEPLQIKRKRGRPKLNGRKPGRPRKNPLPEVSISTASNSLLKKKKNKSKKLNKGKSNESLCQAVDSFTESNINKNSESPVIIEQETLFLRRSPNINISPNEHVPVEKMYESTNHEFDSVKRKIDAAIKACVDKIKNTKRNDRPLLDGSQSKYIVKTGTKRKGGFLGPKLKPNIMEATLTSDEINMNKPRLKAELLSQYQTKKHLSKIKRKKFHKLVTSAIQSPSSKQGSEVTTISDDSSIEEDDDDDDATSVEEECEENEPVPIVSTSLISGSDDTELPQTLSDPEDPSTFSILKQKKILKGAKGDKRKESVECKLPLKKRKLTLTVKDDGTASSDTSIKIVSVTVDEAELKETSALPGKQTLKGFEEGSKSRKRRAQQRKREDKPPKKKYWKAGMYSSSFKEEVVQKKNVKSTDEVIDRPPCGYLPRPIHVGRYLREKRRDFTLPYDLWWLSMRKKLMSRQDNISFKKIRTNLHIDVKPTAGMEHVRCSCTPPIPDGLGCGEDCINRMTFTECNIDTCPCGERCSNQQIQRHQWSPDLERFMTIDRGWGIVTKTSIKAHQFILEYVGEVISVKEFMKRATTDYQHRKHHYCLNLDSNQVIDGHRAGNEGRFVNHSCEPNCEMQKWCVQGVYRIALFSLQDIPADEELTYDYNFHAFSSEGQQICKCKSQSCRGYIGGRTQKPNSNNTLKKLISNKRVGRPPKDKRKSKKTLKKLHNNSLESDSIAKLRLQLPKPMSLREMKIIAERQILLIRNIEKVKRVREALRRVHMVTSEAHTPKEDDRDVFMAQFRALNSSRSVKTRHLAAAEENTEVTTAAKLAQVFKDIYTAVCTYRDTSGQCLAIPFMNLPSKKRNRDYYNRIPDPIDLSTIERKIVTGHYKTVNSFDEDFKKLFRNAEKYHGKKSVLGRDAVHLYKVYSSAMTTSSKQFRNIEGLKSVAESTSKEDGKKNSKEEEEEEVIRCLCGLLNDEGLMIQCDKCMVWQHYDCIGLSYEPENYVCELCKPREVADEIKMKPQPKYAQPGQTYYLCLTREDGTQVKMGDCVYLPRTQEDNAPVIIPSNTNNHSNHIIFRVEQLWKNDKGERCAFGHHFLRPHETHHTPSRKFFKNELFRGPFYEIIRIDLINGFCCVMDLYTYCKGRPKNFKEEDIYICEYRLDKTAHLFHPISKNKFPICTKSYAFNKFEKKIIPKRDYSPHYVPEHYKRGYGGRPTWKCNKDKSDEQPDLNKQDIAMKRMRKLGKKNNENRQQKQKRVNAISLGLLDKLPGMQRR
ncbi:uncharacterized protein [Antedon mediterranea]|uniref:uncharacterized protein isoform X2 n=1 Tax=Antedon mediterranea TaxID=105859 RepID=UPI003AF93B0C